MDPFLGEIRMVGFNYAPQGWALCNGQLLSISSNSALFALLGTTYGGNGQSNFALPNLQSRVPIHAGQGAGLQPYTLGEAAGVESVTLLTSQMPLHTHGMMVDASPGGTADPNNAYLAQVDNPGGDAPFNSFSSSVTNAATLAPNAIVPSGGNQPHSNLQPFLVVNFIIALQGVFPPRS